MTEETRQIQLANRIKFGSRSFRSIEHEREHDFNQTSFLVDMHEITTYQTTIQINVIQPVIDVDDYICSILNHYSDYHFVPGKFLQS